MAFAYESTKGELILELAKYARDRLPSERAHLVVDLMGVLYQDATPEDLFGQRIEHLYAMAVSALAFMDEAPPTVPRVRVYAPRLDEVGWHSPHTVIEITQRDMPFLVDSITGELSRSGLELEWLLHPIIKLKREAGGKISGLRPAAVGDEQELESLVHIRIRAQPESRFEEIRSSLLRILDDVRATVEDFPKMRERCAAVVEQVRAEQELPQEDREEIALFLEWLSERHFTYLGYRYCTFVAAGGRHTIRPNGDTALGVLREPSRRVFDDFQPGEAREVLRLFKANERSTVHRPVHYDAVVVKDLSNGGNSVHMFVGLFSLSAYARSTGNIPLLRQKVRRTVEQSGYLCGSHNGKKLRYILETYPRDELFQISDEALLRISTGILHMHDRQRVAFFAREDPFGRFVSCLVYVPRDRLDTELRMSVARILTEAFRGALSAYYTHLSDDPLARLHMIVKTTMEDMHVDHKTIERRLHEATRSWEDRLEAALINDFGEELGSQRARRYAAAFPVAYRESFDELAATRDVEFIEDALQTERTRLFLYRPVEAEPHQLCLKIFIPSGTVVLSDIVPRLENMGLRVVGEVPFTVPLEDGRTLRVHDFSLAAEDEVAVDLAAVRDAFVEVFTTVWQGKMDDDGFNKLVLHAGLSARGVKLIRAYASYLRQIKSPFSQAYMQSVLKRHPFFVQRLVFLFELLFEPSAAEELPMSRRQERSAEVVSEIVEFLDGIASLDEDRILRAFLSAVQGTLRTNFYQKDGEGEFKDTVALKFDGSKVKDLPLPRPFREIFVFGPRLEGVHLRFGEVARGGLRWSDRREDFRTEVLGLVKAQRVKNSVIVPVGSKGGFVLKSPPPSSSGRDVLLTEAVACYKTFIRALLDITDNRVGSEVEHPPGVVVHDSEDPYLVVAADKGTATFSDFANEVSEAYGFWLGDAFASGGSAGYDHKKMGITARGAWESVKRLFRGLGKDIQREPFTCAGVGDMSGDVFGNGMLLSKQTRLVAAFNHLHIFVDPDPDPKASFAERRRLFELPRSSWSDYDPESLSAGGAVFQRSAKSLKLSPEIRAALEITADEVTPNELIHAILSAPVELLFFGGIGTYIKGRGESNAEVGDRANDALRIDGTELRAKVVGEGANLGMTQRGRIEYSLAGGCCHTDFIDNSGGVDCSDHEVNLKILLGAVERDGDMTRKQRNELLSSMTDDVAEHVLVDNYKQTQTLAVTYHLGSYLTDRLSRFMRTLEREGVLNRELEFLPTDEELSDRVRRRVGYTRPELAVLLSYSKNRLYTALLGSDLPDEPYLQDALLDYFPARLHERFGERILRHQLRREIIATVVSNDVLNRVGLTFVQEAQEQTGRGPAEVAKAYVVANEVLQMEALSYRVEQLDGELKTQLQAAMLVECGRCVTAMTAWLLKAHNEELPIAELVAHYGPGFAELRGALCKLLPEGERRELAGRVEERVAQGIEESLALDIGLLPHLAPAGDIVQISLASGTTIQHVAELYFVVGTHFGLSWLRSVGRKLPVERAWDRQAVASVVDELFVTQRALVSAVLESADTVQTPEQLVHGWCEQRRALVERNNQLVSDLRATPSPNFAMLAVANGQLKSLLPDVRRPPPTGPGSVRAPSLSR